MSVRDVRPVLMADAHQLADTRRLKRAKSPIKYLDTHWKTKELNTWDAQLESAYTQMRKLYFKEWKDTSLESFPNLLMHLLDNLIGAVDLAYRYTQMREKAAWYKRLSFVDTPSREQLEDIYEQMRKMLMQRHESGGA